VPRLTAKLGDAIGGVWRDTRVRLPSAQAQDLLRSRTVAIDERTDAAVLLDAFPLAALYVRG
jgi:maltooligosyltrehalose synthase